MISGRKVDDLHKHIVDSVTFSCEKCGGEMHRVPDVLDTWFDSGAMPYGQVHYMGEGMPPNFPAQFIAEGLDQTRAWFYYLHVLAGALFKKSAFQNVIVNGIVLAEDGKKMSKKLQNYPDPMVIVERYGADALRYYLLSSPVVAGENLNFSEKGVDEALKKQVNRLMNVLAFYQLYSDTSTSLSTGGTPRDWKSANILDRWILSRLDELVRTTTREFEAYRLDAATRPIADFVDDLSTWYLRRSRERFKEEGEDKKAVLATMRYVLHTLSRVIAPSMPFLAEHIFQAVREEEDEESVHLAAWPEGRATANFLMRLLGWGNERSQVLSAMSFARDFVNQALEQRDKAGIRVRQPLLRLTIPRDAQLAKEFFDIIAEEVNVKEVVIGDNVTLDTNITPELREEGVVRDTLRLVQDARKAAHMKPGERGSVTITVAASDRSVVERYLESIKKQTNTDIILS